MSLIRRPDSRYWWTKFRIRGRTVRRSTGETSRAKAEAVEARLREELKDALAGVGHTWDEAAIRWLDEREAKRSLWKDGEIIEWLKPHLSGRRLDSITREDIERVRQAKRAKSAPATVNRYMALVRSILKACVEDWEWLRRVPKVAMYRLEQPEPRWITPAQFRRLLKHLPEHLQLMAIFAVSTGLRRSNITGLRWRDVDLERRHVTVSGREAKGKRGIGVPLNSEALAVLKQCRGAHPTYVFTYQGQPVEQVSTKAWRRAVKKAKLDGLRFHDLRHTWASWQIQDGMPLADVQALGGWRSLQMVQRYAHLSSASLRASVERAERTRGVTFLDTLRKAGNGE